MTSPASSYTQINDFSDELGTTTGLHLDQEFAAIHASLVSVCAALGLVQRSDGKLLNSSVRLENLHAETLRTLMLDATVFKGAWFGGDPYYVGNLATFSGALYLCAEQHYANVFATDLAAGKWYSLSMGGDGGSGVPVVASVPANPSEVGDAWVVFNALDAKLYRWNTSIFTSEVAGADIVNESVTAAKLATDSVTTAKIVDANVTTAKLANDAVTSDKLAASAIQTEHLAAGVVTADKINANGLVIRDADGDPILGVGVDLDMARVFGLNAALDAVSAVFMWIAYANNSTGTSGFTTGAWTNQTYIGVATNKTTATESTDPADYVWSLFKGSDGADGADGTNGIPGAPGADGVTTYTWIAYATNSTGTTGFTTGANTGQEYIGIASNKTTATESTNPADYTWSLIKGADGTNGTNGQRGSRTFYVSGASSWSDASATSAATADGGPVINDIVTEYGSGFSQTKFWDGAVWQTITAAIDGNLLVSGTVGAAALAANSVIAGKIAANAITAAGAEIADLTVGTLKIQDNAVTVPVLAVGTDAQTQTITVYSGTVTKDILSASIDSGGYPVSITLSFFDDASTITSFATGGMSVVGWASGLAAMKLELLRDATVIRTFYDYTGISSTGRSAPLPIASVLDSSPGTGLHTYTLRATWYDGSGGTPPSATRYSYDYKDRSMLLLGIKR